MKKLILSAIFLASASGSYACTFNTPSATETVNGIVARHGGWPISDKNCALLKNNNMTMTIDAMATVLSNASVGWTVVAVLDSKTHIVSDQTSRNTSVNSSTASMNIAEDLMFGTLRDAIANLNFEKAIEEVKTFRSKALN